MDPLEKVCSRRGILDSRCQRTWIDVVRAPFYFVSQSQPERQTERWRTMEGRGDQETHRGLEAEADLRHTLLVYEASRPIINRLKRRFNENIILELREELRLK